MTLQLYFLGPLQICWGDRQLPQPPTLKSQSLLAYLALHRQQPQPRERLVDLFWGERPARKGRRSLSTALWHVRRCLPDDNLILSDTHTVQFAPQGELWLDVEAFEEHATSTSMADLQGAVALYRGNLLDGFYDEWIMVERYRLEALFLEALARLMLGQEAAGDLRAALANALRLLRHDPLQEEAHRLAMRGYCRLGQRNAALAQYGRCREQVLEELGTEPMAETTELYQAILERRFAVGLPHILAPAAPARATGRSPLDVLPPVRLVGREQELLCLDNCWQKARAGVGALVLISGEAGVGKSRLIETFATQLGWQNVRVLWGRCYEFERTLPYQPLAEALRTALPALADGESPPLPAWVLPAAAGLVPEILECPVPDEVPGRSLWPEEDRPDWQLPATSSGSLEQGRLFAAVTRVFGQLSVQGPLLLVLEDLHWASGSTLALLHHLVYHLRDRALLIVGTFRPEALALAHPLRTLRRRLAREGLARPLRLSRLPPVAVETMIREMSGAGDAVSPLAERLYRETEGNPFFVMEIVKTLFETEAIRLEEDAWCGDFVRLSATELPLPTTVAEAIQTRTQRLAERVQDALELAAVIGRTFSFDLLNTVWDRGEEETLQALDVLLRRRLIKEAGNLDDVDFVFTHHKIQEVIYQTLPRARLLYWHARVGTAMETVYGPDLERRAGEAAHHFEQACLLDKTLCDKASTYLLLAGQQAGRQSAHQEAIAYYRRGLEILNTLPETTGRRKREIELQLALAGSVAAVEGYAAPETKRIYERVRALCSKLDETPALFTALMGLSRYYGVSGAVVRGQELAEQLMILAEREGDRALLLEARRHMGGILFTQGRLQEARAHFEQGLKLYEPAQHETHASRFGHDPAVTCLGYLTKSLWLLGYPEQAEGRSREMGNLVSSLTHPSSKAYGHCLLATYACLRHASRQTLEHAEAALRLSEMHNIPSWAMIATTLQGWALVQQGWMAEGMARLQEGTNAWRARGFTHFAPFFLSLQAQAFLLAQMPEEGMGAVKTALSITEAGADHYWLAELHRLRGQLLNVQGEDAGTVAAAFQQALEIARRQEARMLALWAALDLARLWHNQRRSQTAQQVLAEVYHQFDEGFDTYDLREAKSLVENLA